MSLDVYLKIDKPVPKKKGSGIFVRENGTTREVTQEEWDSKHPGQEPVIFQGDDEGETVFVYSANITHNLGAMAVAAGVYYSCWRPGEIGSFKAAHLIGPLEKGLENLQTWPDFYKVMNPSNGWGDYDALVHFVKNYLEACREHPDATVMVSR